MISVRVMRTIICEVGLKVRGHLLLDNMYEQNYLRCFSPPQVKRKTYKQIFAQDFL